MGEKRKHFINSRYSSLLLAVSSYTILIYGKNATYSIACFVFLYFFVITDTLNGEHEGGSSQIYILVMESCNDWVVVSDMVMASFHAWCMPTSRICIVNLPLFELDSAF